jgi:hypothetical protein
VMQKPVLLSSKFGAKSSHIFYAIAERRYNSMWNLMFCLPVRIICEQSL